jgi:hypothetical protein
VARKRAIVRSDRQSMIFRFAALVTIADAVGFEVATRATSKNRRRALMMLEELLAE